MSTSPAPPVPRFASVCSADAVANALDEAGCCIIEGAASDAAMEALVADMAPFVGDTAFGTNDFAGSGTRRTGLVVGRSATFRDVLALHPAILAAGDHVMHHAPAWNLSFAHFFELFPGEPDQPLHRDTWKYGAPPLPFEVDLNALWAVSDFTATNGATRVVPGSHRWDDERRPEPGEAVSAVAPKGSLLLYTGNLYHGGGANTGDSIRLAVNAQHTVGWLSQTELMLLEYPPAVAAAWDDDLIRFIGYQNSGPALGHWRNNEDPFVAIEEYRALHPTPTGHADPTQKSTP